MIPRQTVEQILDAARIEDVIGDFVTLKRRGANLIACCPFHNEKTPSFSVSPSKGIFKCFGCGKSGTAVGFVMEHENMTYTEALKYLAKKYRIEVVEKEETPEDIAARQRGESLMLVSEFASRFFTGNLRTAEGQVGLAYFKSRGLLDDTIDRFGLGWAMNSRSALRDAAREAGFKEEYLIDTGLCFKTDDGKVLDRFYDRAVFPIHDIQGRVIAFGCRTLRNDKSVAKYVNSPETEIYSKRHTLYGMYQAKAEVHRRDKFILVEGYLDVITFHQLGIINVAASSGTSLTVEQVKLIKRFTDNVTIIYDGDSAGIHAALRGIGLLLEGGLNVKVVLLPDGDDPDSFGRKHTLKEVEDFISANEQDFIGFKMRLLLDDVGRDPIGRAGLINDIADTIALIPDPVKRSVYVNFASAELDVDGQLLLDRIARTRGRALEQKRREREREQRNAEEQAAAAVQENWTEGLQDTGMPQDEVVRIGNEGLSDPVLAPCEKELLGFILNNGCTPLRFDGDSPFVAEGQEVTVAELIDKVLCDDGVEFSNQAYRQVYARYFELFDSGLEQSQIIVRLLSDGDAEVRDTTKVLIDEKYPITVKKFAASLTNEGTALAVFVPKALLVYNKVRIEKKIKTLTRGLDGESGQEEIMKQIIELNGLKLKLVEMLGRV